MHETILILFSLLIVFPTFSNELTKNRFHKDFPYALLTNDFGVLNTEDLKINSCRAKPVPLSRANGAYSYWQCFEVKQSTMDCEGNAYDPDSESRVALLVLSGLRDKQQHEFISRRLMPLESCRKFQKIWKQLTTNEPYVCISGSDFSRKKTKGKILWTWIFDRYKTKKGCDSYFEGECSLQYQRNHGCKE